MKQKKDSSGVKIVSKCIACGYKFKHPYEYQNDEAGILLCQQCAGKVSQHYMNDYIVMAEMRAQEARHVKAFMQTLANKEKLFGGNK